MTRVDWSRASRASTPDGDIWAGHRPASRRMDQRAGRAGREGTWTRVEPLGLCARRSSPTRDPRRRRDRRELAGRRVGQPQKWPDCAYRLLNLWPRRRQSGCSGDQCRGWRAGWRGGTVSQLRWLARLISRRNSLARTGELATSPLAPQLGHALIAGSVVGQRRSRRDRRPTLPRFPRTGWSIPLRTCVPPGPTDWVRETNDS